MLHNLRIPPRVEANYALRITRRDSAASLGKTEPCEFFNCVQAGVQIAWAHCTGQQEERDADYAMFQDLLHAARGGA